jgi:osmotically-inducible protein OsmY
MLRTNSFSFREASMERKSFGLAIAVALAASIAACDGNTNHATTTGQKLDNAMAQTKEDLARAGDKVKPAMQRAGDEIERAAQNVKPTLEKAGDKIKEAAHSDAAITTSIKADYLKDPDLSVLKIDVDTHEGVVTLNGLAKDSAAKDRAEKLASGIKGVREVKNHLAVKQG